MNDKILDGHILHIIQNQVVSEQQHLQEQLKQRGFDVAQATLSRRLKKIGITKKNGVYEYNELQSSLPVILNVKSTQAGLIVLHTNPGCANMLAYYLDRKYVGFHPGDKTTSPIIGTLAGDDTVVLITDGPDAIKEIYPLLSEEFPYLIFNP